MSKLDYKSQMYGTLKIFYEYAGNLFQMSMQAVKNNHRKVDETLYYFDSQPNETKFASLTKCEQLNF